MIVAAILFGALILAGREIQPSGVPSMIQGIILFTLIVGDVLVRYRIRIDRGGGAPSEPAPPTIPPLAAAPPSPPSPSPEAG